MVRHGPKCLQGPLSLSHSWGRDAREEVPDRSVNETLAEQAGIRWELVQRVRREIAAGTYETPEKWEAALDALFSDLETK